MDAVKEKIKELFFKNVYGLSPNIEGYDKKHAGAKGHWLEKKLGKRPDASNEADFWGYECKNFTSNKTTWGDWSANEYIFDKNNNSSFLSMSDVHLSASSTIAITYDILIKSL